MHDADVTVGGWGEAFLEDWSSDILFCHVFTGHHLATVARATLREVMA